MYLKAFYTFKNSSVKALLQATETDYGMLVKRKMYLNDMGNTFIDSYSKLSAWFYSMHWIISE